MPRMRGRHTRRQRTHRAGALIGQGSYGCGYANPPLQCEGEPLNPAHFSKLVSTSTAEDEYENAAHIRRVDPTGAYSVYPIAPPCKLHPDMVASTSQIYEKDAHGNYKCRLIAGPISRNAVRVLQLENAGHTIDSYKNLGRDEIVPLYEAMLNLFEGLVQYHAAGFYHMDIKPDNIVIQRAGSSFKAKYIDFGLSLVHTRTAAAAAPDFSDVYENNYYIWPYELRFLTPDHDLTATDFAAYVQHGPAMLLGSIPPRTYMPRPWLLDGAGNSTIDLLEYKQIKERLYNTMSADERIEQVLSLTDVYGLGLFFCNICFRIFNQRFRGGAIEYVDPLTGDITPLERLPPKQRAYEEKVAEKIVRPAMALVMSMTDPNMFYRVNAKKALAGYKHWLRGLRRFMDAMHDNVPSLATFFPAPEFMPSPVAAAATVAPSRSGIRVFTSPLALSRPPAGSSPIGPPAGPTAAITRRVSRFAPQPRTQPALNRRGALVLVPDNSPAPPPQPPMLRQSIRRPVGAPAPAPPPPLPNSVRLAE